MSMPSWTEVPAPATWKPRLPTLSATKSESSRDGAEYRRRRSCFRRLDVDMGDDLVGRPVVVRARWHWYAHSTHRDQLVRRIVISSVHVVVISRTGHRDSGRRDAWRPAV